ncbi:MFS transporter [Salimicrobium salexigens]|uniref:Predicted arabinose efflux permease, MFS family n=1 Tax=Salimicrobium salexigens TaxID=908941 RepID=A0ABY1KXC0_9BACI|nr:MFS transporter [Salimicrobium salexigens]SIS74920.1 Predicted arabinose efflux permease, MFS family [Salimicrobium salexigens]
MNTSSFRFLWVGQTLANLGDVIYIVALISILYTTSQSAFYLALLPFVNTFARFISGYLSPVLFNKYPLKTLLFGSQSSKTFFLFVLASLTTTQLRDSLMLIFSLVFVIAFLDGWAAPASRAMIPRLVDKKEIVQANSFFSVVSQIVQLGGWALGGLLVATAGGQYVIWLTLFLYILSAGLLMFLRDSTTFRVPYEKSPLRSTLKEGWEIIWQNPIFRKIHVVIFLESIASVVWIAAIIYVFVSEVLQKNEAWWGYINTTFFLGLLVGGVVCTKYAIRVEKNLKKLLLATSFIVSIVTICFGYNSLPWMALVLSVLYGAVEQVKSIAMETYLQKEASSENLPKIYGAQEAMTSLTFGCASLLFGWMSDVFGVSHVFLFAGILLMIAAVYLALSKHVFPATYVNEFKA